MAGLWTFALAVCVIALALKVRRLHYRLAVVEHVQMKRLMGDNRRASLKETEKAMVEDILDAAKYPNFYDGVLDAAKEALKN